MSANVHSSLNEEVHSRHVKPELMHYSGHLKFSNILTTRKALSDFLLDV